MAAHLEELQKLKDWLFGYHGNSTIATGKLWERMRELETEFRSSLFAKYYDFDGIQIYAIQDWEAAADGADMACLESLNQKQEDFERSSKAAADRWASALADAEEQYEIGKTKSIERFENAIAKKERELELRYNALSSTIAHVYDFHLQRTLQTALEQARDETSADCEARYADWIANAKKLGIYFV